MKQPNLKRDMGERNRQPWCCIASGKDFHGLKVNQGPVVFILAEGKNGLKRRFKAWAIKNEIPLEGLPIFISNTFAQLSFSESVDQVEAAVFLAAEGVVKLSEIKRF